MELYFRFLFAPPLAAPSLGVGPDHGGNMHIMLCKLVYRGYIDHKLPLFACKVQLSFCLVLVAFDAFAISMAVHLHCHHFDNIRLVLCSGLFRALFDPCESHLWSRSEAGSESDRGPLRDPLGTDRRQLLSMNMARDSSSKISSTKTISSEYGSRHIAIQPYGKHMLCRHHGRIMGKFWGGTSAGVPMSMSTLPRQNSSLIMENGQWYSFCNKKLSVCKNVQTAAHAMSPIFW